MKIKNIYNKETEEVITEDFETINFNDKEFRIYKWEDKEIGDFNIPEGFKLAKHSQFIELFDNKLIVYPKESYLDYFVEHYSKRKTEEGYLSSCSLNWGSGLVSDDSDLAVSVDDGRVVVVK